MEKCRQTDRIMERCRDVEIDRMVERGRYRGVATWRDVDTDWLV